MVNSRTPINPFGLGNRDVVRDMQRAFREDNVPQASLIVGRSGYGLLHAAIDIARILLCEHRGDTPCEACAGCHLSGQLQHPDLHLMYPVIKPKNKVTNTIRSEDFVETFRAFMREVPYGDYEDWKSYLGDDTKQLNIYASMIEEMEHHFSMKPHQGIAKVHIIWGAEFLGIEGNKLLKAIEEPAANHYIILLAEDRKHILPTIQSRCQHFLLSKPGSEDIQHYFSLLGKEADIDPTDFEHDMHQIQYGHQKDRDDQQLWIQLLRLAYSQNHLGLYDEMNALTQRKQNACILFLESGLGICRQLIRSRLGIPLDNQNAVERLAQLMEVEDIEGLASRIDADIRHIRRNANLRVIMVNLGPFLMGLMQGVQHSAAKR